MSRFHTVLPAMLLLHAPPLAAQEAPTSVPTPSATPAPAPVSLPSPTPTPTPPAVSRPTITAPGVAPTPTAIATPRAVETPAARPVPRSTTVPLSSPTPSPTPAAGSSAPAPEPSATPAPPLVIASPLPTTDDAAASEASTWPWMLAAAVLVLAGIGLLAARRRRTPEGEAIGIGTEPEAIGPPLTTAPAERPGARLALGFRPTRVGFNMLTATAQGELTIVNEGDEAIGDVRVRTALLGAHVGQDADLAAFLAEPIGRPDVPAFALAPGEARTVRVLAAAARATLRTMTAAGRPMFVPVLAVNLRTPAGQVAQAFAIGAERVDSAKLAPFWLDQPDRTYTEVAARPHGPATRQPNG